MLPPVCKTITDWNSAVTNGFYMAEKASNAPREGWCFGRVIAHNSAYLVQEIMFFTADVTLGYQFIPQYKRLRENNIWRDWIRTSEVDFELSGTTLYITGYYGI